MACKVDTLLERYALPTPAYDSVDKYLVVRWTGRDDHDAEGYKPLTEWFNKQMLRRRYDAHGRDVTSVHLDREYELVTGDASAEREELAADLAADGLDIDRLADELVSWSTMRHHLKDCLDATKEPATASTDWQTNTVEMATTQAAEKTRSVLSSLASTGRLPDAEEADVDVQVELHCPDCSASASFQTAVERGYVCETHAEETSRERVGERSAAALFGVFEGSRALLNGPYLADVLAVVGL